MVAPAQVVLESKALAPTLPREDAVRALQALVGTDLRALAERYGVVVWTHGRLNKGWAGQTLERHLGLAANNEHAPDFGDWELKVVPLMRGPDGQLRVKETMAITMFDAGIVSTRFEDSPLYQKLRSLVLVARIYEGRAETRSIVWGVDMFDLGPDLTRLIKDDYRRVQDTVRIYGLDSVTGRLGHLVQPRPKGAGHGSTTRAFYARSRLIAHIFDLR